MSDNLQNNTPIELIARVVSGNASDKEVMELDRWCKLSRDNEELYNRYKIIWSTARKPGIDFPVINIDEEFELFRQKLTISSEKKPTARTISKIARFAAAALVLLVLGLSVLTMVRIKEYKTIRAVESIAYHILPDGSEVTMYPGTSLRFRKDFKGEIREITLDGETFFEVKRDTLRPFVIKTNYLQVEVLGTSFNVRSDKETKTEVVVREGKVAVTGIEKGSGREILVDGEMVTVERENGLLIKSVNTDPNYTAWKTRKIVFNDSSLEEICSVLSKVYNIDISCDSGKQGKRLTADFENSDIGYVIETIEATLDIKAEYIKGGIIFR